MTLQTATNPETGDRVALVGDSWQPILQSATNKEGGKAYLVGNNWLTDKAPSRQNVQAESDKSVLGFGGNVLSSGANLVGGIGHAVMHPLETTKGILDVGAGALQNVLPKSVVDTVNKIDTLFNADPEAAKRAVAAADAMGGVYKERYGSPDKLLNTLYTDPVGAAADLSTILGLGGGALKTVAGAAKVANAPEMAANVAKAITPVETMANVTNPLSAVTGRIPFTNTSVLGAAAGLSGKTLDWLSQMTDPKSAALLKMTEGQAPAVIEAIRNNPGLVEGYNPSVAERASGLGLTKLAAAERETKPYASTNVLANDIANREAIVNKLAVDPSLIGKIEQVPTAITTAEEIRNAAAKKNYGDIENKKIAIDGTLKAMLEKPSMKEAVADAKKSATEKTNQYFPANAEEPYSVANLQRMKESLDKGISAAKKSENAGIRPTLTPAELIATKDEFVSWLNKKEPKWQIARETYAEQSKPINRMEIRQALAEKITSNLNPEGKLQGAAFKNALAEAAGTIKKATGEARYGKLREIMTPAEMKDFQNISDELARASKTEEQAMRGSKEGAIIPAVSVPHFPALLSRSIALANMLLRKLQGKVTDKLARDLALELIIDPEKGAISLEKALQRQNNIETIKSNAAPIKEAISAGAKKLKTKEAATIGRISNALAPQQQQNQNALAR